MALDDESVDEGGPEDRAEDEAAAAAVQRSRAGKHDSMRAADLERVTDYVEEAEILSQNIGDAMKVVSDRQLKEANEKQLKENELSRVKVNKEDIDLVVNEMEVSRNVAERLLREHRGNVFDVLVSLTN